MLSGASSWEGPSMEAPGPIADDNTRDVVVELVGRNCPVRISLSSFEPQGTEG